MQLIGRIYVWKNIYDCLYHIIIQIAQINLETLSYDLNINLYKDNVDSSVKNMNKNNESINIIITDTNAMSLWNNNTSRYFKY
jgi:hypothetical protein